MREGRGEAARPRRLDQEVCNYRLHLQRLSAWRTDASDEARTLRPPHKWDFRSKFIHVRSEKADVNTLHITWMEHKLQTFVCAS